MKDSLRFVRPVCVCVALSAVLTWTASLFAQNTQAPAIGTEGLRFDAVSVRVAKEYLGYRVSPGRFSVAGQNLSDLINSAYQIPHKQILLPDWIRPLVFSVEATFPPTTSQEQFREMLRAMLAERFSFRAKRELREMPVLLLVRARRDGSLGPQMYAVQKDCSKPGSCFMRQPRGTFEISGWSWEQIRLAPFVSAVTQEIVLDRTGLSGGQYDLTLRWQPDLAVGDSILNSDRPSTLQGALEEQLGLKLERAREHIEVLVVENVAMPSEN